VLLRIVLASAALLLTACGGGGDAEEPAPTPTPDEAALAPLCADVQPPRTGRGAPQPAGTGEDVLVARAHELQTWALQEAPDAFGGVWLDRSAGVVLTVAFSSDVDRWRGAVEERFGDSVAVVAVAHSQRELVSVQSAIAPQIGQLEGGGRLSSTGQLVMINRVSVGVLGDALVWRDLLTAAHGADILCFEVGALPGEEDAKVARWAPAPDADVGPEVTTIPILVNEMECASGQSAEGRVLEPAVDYRDDAVVVTVRVIPLGGAQTCPGNPNTPASLELTEPLGERVLLDGGAIPPAPPVLTGSTQGATTGG
jgi:hypothetical protein